MFLWTGHFVHRPDQLTDEKRKPGLRPTKQTKIQAKLTPLQNDKFKAVLAIDKELNDAVSFQYPKKNGWYLTVKDDLCFIEPKRRSSSYERASSFFPLMNFWYDGYTVYESAVKAGWYLRLHKSKVILAKYDGSEDFKTEASFKTSKNSDDDPRLQTAMSTCCSCSSCESRSDIIPALSHYADCGYSETSST